MRRDQRSEEAKAWRHLYGQARWRGPHGRRAQQLAKQPLCEMCLKAQKHTAATVADHKQPHKGDLTLFWHGPLQSLCAPHHDSTKQGEDRRGYSGEVDADGWPSDPAHPANASQNG